MAVTKKIGDIEMIKSWDVDKHTHISAIEENRVTNIVQKHKVDAIINPNINPHQVFANINAELAQTGGGVMTGSQKSLAGNIHRMYETDSGRLRDIQSCLVTGTFLHPTP